MIRTYESEQQAPNSLTSTVGLSNKMHIEMIVWYTGITSTAFPLFSFIPPISFNERLSKPLAT